MSNLTDFKLLSFDVYGTLIDWERGILTALEPTLQASSKTNLDSKHILKVFNHLEASHQAQSPSLKYSDLLTTIHPQLCKQLELNAPTQEQSRKFGQSVSEWPAFPDTLDALKRLSKVYKLVVLSNVDNESFKKGTENALKGFQFDAVYTAEDIGSYKPSLGNFEYMLRHVKAEFGIEKHQVLQTAQSQFHDHYPAKEMGLKSAWIVRAGAAMGAREDPVYDWKFDRLADMADAVEGELENL